MVISNIIGGLGNQMFQYATGRTLSLRLSVQLKLDLRDFSSYPLHQGFELSKLFDCNVEIASNNDLKAVLGWQEAKLVQRILKRPQLNRFSYRSYVIEPSFNYWVGINTLKENIYLDGYWQSERYFISFADKIREDFTFKQPLSNQNADIADKISRVNAVSLHVRRGDYISDKRNAFIGVCTLDYYKTAIEIIKTQVDNPMFFVYSDDINWVKNNLVLDKTAVFVNHNLGHESYNDMRLMSLCQHHIIANSSFSWWGAWLNNSPNKIVIAPKQWFANMQDTSDLMPENWLKM